MSVRAQGTNFYREAGIRGFEETARPGVVGSFPDFGWSGYSAMNGSAFDQRPNRLRSGKLGQPTVEK